MARTTCFEILCVAGSESCVAAQMQCTYKDLRKTPSKHLHVAMALQKPPTVYDGGTRWLYLTPDKLLQAHADMQVCAGATYCRRSLLTFCIAPQRTPRTWRERCQLSNRDWPCTTSTTVHTTVPCSCSVHHRLISWSSAARTHSRRKFNTSS